ncbi:MULTISPECIES: ABC transporter substrate-binding protein [Streptomyces]|uniref:ABC transporter substrate-binding protein n=1 Tax=Streptomyces solicathayae TaxID=3081768 RepID=A0ABZ0M250_9ACTN|nr:ABC transporter substrate-binding protein [Streptomyces sp. HUAS YS2]WOX25839.1 ABC transporter substrate-binding protein [Streptomyces sp. HUAS YS2]
MYSPRPRGRTKALAAVVAAALALAGCSAGTSGTGASGSSDALTTLTPAGSGTVDKITWNVFQGEPQTVDPFHAADYTPNMINSNMCETLFAQTPDFKIKPNLATSYTNPDPKTWVYKLRDDVTFWDGSPMTADDVAWSMNHNLTDKTSFYGYLYRNVASITKTGTAEVTVKLKAPDYLFNDELASYAGVVVQKKFYERHGDKVGTPGVGVMCTGPYKFAKWTQGQSISASRYDGYWNKELPLKVKHIDFTFLTDDSAITSGLLSGQIDGTYGPPTAGLSQLRASSAGKLYSGPAPLAVTLVVANDKGAMGNADVRKALQMAIDWKGIGQQVYGGEGSPASLQTVPAVYGFAKDELTKYADSVKTDGTPKIDAAKKLLAGVPADVKAKQISLVVPQQAETQQLGVGIKDAADRMGLKFKLNVVPATGYSNYLYDPATRGDTDLLYTQFWPNIPNPLDWLGITAVSGGSFNQSGYKGVDDLYAKAVGEKDDKARAQLVVQMEKKLHDEMTPMLSGIQLTNDVWLGSRITGAPAAFDYVYYPWAAHLAGTGK